MEQAFEGGQEMVVFVTELNTNFYSIQYLKENDCDKYYRYNKRLLFDEQQENVLSMLAEVEDELKTSVDEYILQIEMIDGKLVGTKKYRGNNDKVFVKFLDEYLSYNNFEKYIKIK
mgnify:CR=1 FL=1